MNSEKGLETSNDNAIELIRDGYLHGDPDNKHRSSLTYTIFVSEDLEPKLYSITDKFHNVTISITGGPEIEEQLRYIGATKESV